MITLGIDLPTLFASLGVIVQIFFIDLLLSADNALLIAMSVRTLPPDEMRVAVVIGTMGAIGLRLVMAAVVLFLLDVPYLKLVASVLLLAIALRLTLERADAKTVAAIDAIEDVRPAWLSWRGMRAGMLGAIASIMVADAVMSLDNVVAIAAVANGSIVLLAFGLALSIPMLVYGSSMIRRFLSENGTFVLLAGMFLGWIAGSIAVSDPALAPWVESSAPALAFAVPVACAAFVLWESRILAPRRPSGVTRAIGRRA